MKLKNKKSDTGNLKIALITIISGILLGITYYSFLFPLGWICYVALFYILISYRLKPFKSFLVGFLAATIHGLIIFSWMPVITTKYTGSQINSGYIFSLIGALIFAIKTGISFIILSHLINKYNGTSIFSKIILLLGAAFAFVVTDWMYSIVFIDVPWMLHFFGYTQATDLYFSQIAEIGGVWLITFFLIIINLIFAIALVEKSRKLFLASIFLLIIIHIYGLIRLATLNENGGKQLKIALICDNTEPEIRWNGQFVNEYVQTLFRLNKEAVSHNPDLIIWNEGAIPWSYKKDDDFLKEILKQTEKTKAYQLLSYFTVTGYDSSYSYNSAYLFNKNGQIEGRYDKSRLLGGLEKPLWNIKALQLPFFNANTKSKNMEGTNIKPLEASVIGKVGVLICNESLTDNLTSKLAASGAGFLTLMANDNWFLKTQLPLHHFYHTRLRAIETRKDIVINSNLGYSGLVTSTGEIKGLSNKTHPEVLFLEVNTNNKKSQFETRKEIFLYISFLLLTIISLKKRRKKL